MNYKFVTVITLFTICISAKVVSQDLALNSANVEKKIARFELNADGCLVPAKLFNGKRTMDDHNNSVGFGLYILPQAIVDAEAFIAFVEFERFLNERNSILGRLEFIGYNFTEDEVSYYENENGIGGAIGFSYRHYFSDYGGFFASPGVEVGLIVWDYNYTDKFGFVEQQWERGTSLAIAPNLAVGYCLNFGSRVSLTPAVMIGYRIGIGLESDDETENGTAPIGGFGVSLKFRFNSEN